MIELCGMELSEFLSSYQSAIPWKSLKGGSYNRIFITEKPVDIEQEQCHWIIKQPIVCADEQFPLNTVERAIRKFHEINPNKFVFNDGDRAWFLPFFGDSPERPAKASSDDQTAIAVFDIYKNTGNIVADAAIAGNILEYQNELICVDVDLANRRGSIPSDDYFNTIIASEVFDNFFSQDLKKVHESLARPLTAIYVKLMFYIDECLSQFSGDYQSLELEMLPFLFKCCIKQIKFTEPVFHNLCLLFLDERKTDVPVDWLEPNLFFQAKKAANFEELYSVLEANHQAWLALESSASTEELVASLLDNLIDTIDNEMKFEYAFFANLPKRPFELEAQAPSCACSSPH
jgi:hypothetical protein